MTPLALHHDGRHFADGQGKTVYLIGDTAWELFHRLNREEAREYLACRAEQGFNFIQCVVLAEICGLTEPNAYGALPLLRNEQGVPDPEKPDLRGEYSYFDHVEFIVEEAERLGLRMGILPTWGDKFNRLWGEGPEIFSPESAYSWGKWLASRLARHGNIVWILGGDRPLTEQKHFAVVDAMARGLADGDGGKFLKTLHPCGGQSSSAYVHERPWLDFNMFQSGHGWPPAASHEMALHDRSLVPVKPTMDAEQRYEDHPINFDPKNGYYDAVDVRATMWRNLFSGTAGNTYGHHAVWPMRRECSRYFPNTWKTALHRPGAESVRVLAAFVFEHDVAAFEPFQDAVEGQEPGANWVAAVRCERERRAYLYIPCGVSEVLHPGAYPSLPEKVSAFSPADGAPIPVTVDADGRLQFPGRAAGRGMDAVVILDFSAP